MYHLPSTWRRLAARLTDDVYIFILQSPVVYFFLREFFQTGETKIHWAHAAYFVLIRVAYETFTVAFFSATLGKLQMGLRVINKNRESAKGDPIAFDQALLRALVCQLSHIVGWSLFVTAFYKHNRTHVADWIADTQVVSLEFKRKERPRRRWLFATGFIFFFMAGSIKGTAMTLQSMTWKRPFLYIENSELTKVFNEVELNFDDESVDEEFED